MIFVDGVEIGDVADVALRDRRMLSADGIFVVVATISEQDGTSVAEPEVIFRGVPFRDEAERAARRASATPSRTRWRARPSEEIREIDVLQSDAARRPRGARLRPAQAPPDGAAGRRRGSSGRPVLRALLCWLGPATDRPVGDGRPLPPRTARRGPPGTECHRAQSYRARRRGRSTLDLRRCVDPLRVSRLERAVQPGEVNAMRGDATIVQVLSDGSVRRRCRLRQCCSRRPRPAPRRSR